MDILTIVIAIIGGISTIIGIVKGLLELVDFTQKKKQAKASKNSTVTNPDILGDSLPLQNKSENSPKNKNGIFHNLPPRNEFIGRKEELKKLHKALSERSHIICIDGIGGIGKTSLAREFAHECLEKSNITGTVLQNSNTDFKGYIWIETKDDNKVLEGILDDIAYTLTSNHIEIQKQPIEEKKKTILKVLQGVPSLIFIDGYETMIGTDVENFLLKIPEPSKVLITTRNKKIPQSKLLSLRGLSETDSLDFIKTHGYSIDYPNIETINKEKLILLYKAVEGHPLAIKWILGQIKQSGLDTTLKYLSEAKGDIFDEIFLKSWNLLTQDAQDILRIMPIFVTDASRQAIEIGSHIFGDEFDKAILQLTEMSLVQIIESQNNSSQRYGIHPLTRAFASVQLEASDPKVSFYTKKNLAHFFEEHTRTHGGLWNLDGFQIIKLDIFNIISIIKWCIEEGFFEISANLIDNIRYFLINYGYWNIAIEIATDATKLFSFEVKSPTHRLKEWQTKIALLRLWPIAWIHRFRGNLEDAKKEITSVMHLFEFDKDEYNLAYVKRHLSLVVQQMGELEMAEKLLIEAREFSYTIQDESERNYRVQLLTADLSVLALKKGNLDSAWNLSSSVFDIAPQILNDTENHNYQNLQTISVFYRVLGSVARQRGNFEQAKDFCEKALYYTEKLDYRDGIADSSYELAQIELEMGKNNSARQRFERAYSIYKSLGMKQRTKEIEEILSNLENEHVR